MKRKTKIAVDLLGAETSPEQLAGPLASLHEELKDRVQFSFFVPENFSVQLPAEIHVIRTDEVIGMEDDPLAAVRKKKQASLVQGVLLVKEGAVDAFISAGNTGALLASCQIQLPLLAGIERAALLALLPTMRKEMGILDVGATLSCTADQLVQLALMGVAYQKSRGLEKPVVGLLNVGTEPKKGTPEMREAYKKLKDLFYEHPSVTFIGNVEGRDAFKGELDILVTDGFAGNVFLKTSEGLAQFLMELVEEGASALAFSPLKGLLSTLRKRLDYGEYPGALVCGIEGIVIKCHGTASPQSFVSSVKMATRLVEHGFLENIRQNLQQ